jgi:hypothetical protein
MSFLSALALRIRSFIGCVGAISDHVILVRIPLLLVAAGTFLTLRVDQISEFFFLLGKGGERPLRDAVAALAATFLLGLAVWYSSRVLFRFRFAPRPALANPRLAWLRKWLPRGLGGAVPLLMAIGCIGQLRTKTHAVDAADQFRICIYAALYLAEAFVIAFFVVKRRDLMRAYERRRAIDPGARTAVDPLSEPVLHSLRELQSGYRFFQFALLANAAVFLLAVWSPTTLAKLGALALIQLTAVFFVLTGTWVLSWTERYAIPVLTLLVAAMLGQQLFVSNDNHHVRQTAAQASYQTVTPQITNVRDGRQALARRLSTMPEGPIFLVSAEGGGMRAAAWTALVMTRMDHLTHGAFGDHLFAASGVSGGSLGIATYAAMRRLRIDNVLDTAAFYCGRRPAAALDVCPAREFLTRDFLSPVLSNMLIVDQAQRWLPIAFLPDRGSTLERAWERAWEQITHASPGAFSKPWRLEENDDHDPWMLFNTTVVSSGQRMIEQPFAFEAAEFDVYFPGAINGALRLQGSAPLSAVVHNSARFTYVSPAGTLDPPVTNPPSPPLQVVDGGYFENSGTTTLLGVYRFLTQPGGASPAIDPKRIVIIHISNDPLVPPMRLDGQDTCLVNKKGLAGEREVLDTGHFGELASPLVSLLNTREARGELARQAIVREAQAHNGDNADDVLHFRLCRGDHELPLGWMLSDAAWTELTRQLGDVRIEEETRNIDLNVRQLDIVRAFFEN